MKLNAPLLIRADANVAMGTGHVMRCLALAQAWQDAGGKAVFAMAESTPAVRSRLISEGMEVVSLDVKPGEENDARRVAQLASDCGAVWVVVDGYHFNQGYIRELKSAGLKTLFVDDAGSSEACVADVILNANSDADRTMYPRCEPGTRLLLGTSFALLRREFARWREWKRETPPQIHRLLVTMGGSDPDNLTGLVVQALGVVKTRELQATVIAGGSNPHLAALQREAAAAGAGIRLQETASDMPELIAQSDIAIIAGGGTLWELLYMSCPVITFGRNPIQRRILGELDQRGVVRHLGDPQCADPRALAMAIDELATAQSQRAKMAILGRQLVDGEGPRRMCEVLGGLN